MKIFNANPKAGYTACKEEIDTAVARVLESGWYVLGSEVKSFEKEFASYVGAGFAVGAANGTQGLELSLRVLDIGPGDKVITVSHTAVATIAAIECAGAEPVLLDIEPDSFTLSPDRLNNFLENCPESCMPKAVIPVHLYGHPCNMPAINAIAKEYGLKVIEDCAQAHGAKINDQKVGSFGDMAEFSFYPTKNLAALGDGGAVTTDNAEYEQKLRFLQQYGWKERYISDFSG
ncbi:MAG: DegT/DnrJ/EryC1/StrS family aminotransferase, partial [Planctomycetota bacterium]